MRIQALLHHARVPYLFKIIIIIKKSPIFFSRNLLFFFTNNEQHFYNEYHATSFTHTHSKHKYKCKKQSQKQNFKLYEEKKKTLNNKLLKFPSIVNHSKFSRFWGYFRLYPENLLKFLDQNFPCFFEWV